MTGTRLTPEQQQRARSMHANGIAYHRIAERIASNYTSVRGLLDPEYRERRRQENRRRERKRKGSKGVREFSHKIEIPTAVLWMREARLSTPMSLTASLMGDPPPGYSALDHKRREQNAGRG